MNLNLFIDSEGKIKAGEFPEKPNYDIVGLSAFETRRAIDRLIVQYEAAVQAALDNGVEVADQDEALTILQKAYRYNRISEFEYTGILSLEDLEESKPYPIPYKMEVKMAMSCGFEGENLCALNEKDCPNHLHGTCQEKKLATLTLINNV